MNKKLVFVPIAYKNNYSMSANMQESNENGVEIYLKNSYVLLHTVKKYNKNVDVAIVVNFDVPREFMRIFQAAKIDCIKIEFDEYLMPADFKWSLAFFKMTALKYVVEKTDYDAFLELDSDEICISDFSDMWSELERKILMYYSAFRINHPTRILYSELYRKIYNKTEDEVIPKTGGGFIAGNKKNLEHFIKISDEIYSYMQKNIGQIDKNVGDELYSSIYCGLFPERVQDARSYIAVYWTGSFYYVSTNYKYDAVSIIHLPDEKRDGLLFLYDYLIKRGRLPNLKRVFKILSFPKTRKSFCGERIIWKMRRKARKILQR